METIKCVKENRHGIVEFSDDFWKSADWSGEHLDNQGFSMQRDLPLPSFANGDGGSAQ